MKNVIITTALVFIVNLILQGLTSYLFIQDSGSIIVSEPIKIDSLSYSQTLIISNYENKSLEQLEFSVINGRVQDIKCDNRIETFIKPNGNIVVSKIFGNTNNSILLLLRGNIGTQPEVLPLNYKDLSLKFVKSSNLKRDYTSLIYNILTNCFLVALFFGFFLHYVEKQKKELSVNLIEAKKSREKDVENIENKLKELEKNKNILLNFYTKLRILLISRNKDLQKENQFYRDLIKELVKLKSEKEVDDKLLKELITKQLKTYGTLSDFENQFQTIDAIANILKINSSQQQ